MLTVLCNHAHSHLQSTEVCFICYRKGEYYVNMEIYYCP